MAAPYTFNFFLSGHAEKLSEKHDITVFANGQTNQIQKNNPKIKFRTIKLSRKPSLIKDLFALIALIKIIKKQKFDILQSMSPKAGLIANLAAFLCKIPVRIHWFTGQVWANKKGLERVIYKIADKATAFFATNILADSKSQKNFLINEKITSIKKIKVLKNGSVCGVNINKFKASNRDRFSIRQRIKIPKSAIVALFLGRKKIEKGILDLCEAFKKTYEKNKKIYLLLVGPDEENLRKKVFSILKSAGKNTRWINKTNVPEKFMSASDFLVLPSYREGFGSVIIEAAATGRPSIGSNIYGLRDSILNGKTGILFPVGDKGQLSDAISKMAENYKLRLKLAKRGKARVYKNFRDDQLKNAFYCYVSSLLKQKNI